MKSFIFMLISLLLSHTLTGYDMVIPERSIYTRGQLRRLAPPPGGKPVPKKSTAKKKPTTNTAEEGARPPSSSNSRGSEVYPNERGSAPTSSRNIQATSNNRGKASPKTKKPLKRSEELRIQREQAAQKAIAEGKKPRKRGEYSEEGELRSRELVKQKRHASLDESYKNGFDAVRTNPNTPVRGRRNFEEFDPYSDSEYFRYHDRVLEDLLDYNHQYHEVDRSYMRREMIKREQNLTDNLLDLVDYERSRNPSREAQEAWTERERIYDGDYENLRNQYQVENNEFNLLLESMDDLSFNIQVAREQYGWDPAEYIPPRQYERKKWETDEQWNARKRD